FQPVRKPHRLKAGATFVVLQTANPGVNPSLTIAALAEYAMSRVAGK
ncbi:MAG: hypothetical protein HGA65_01440, partial [Oscillochloris sp.]|nr:hypothetical protein [Oscillochloris sp.]